MFNLFKSEKQVIEKITGKIERIGVLPNDTYTIVYIIKLQGVAKLFQCKMYGSSEKIHEAALTQENDEVTFMYDQNNRIQEHTFKNLTFPLQ